MNKKESLINEICNNNNALKYAHHSTNLLSKLNTSELEVLRISTIAYR